MAEEEGLTQYDPKTGEPTASRIGYYEGVGALRDMVQNHMLQVLCMTAMEPPWSLDARRGPRRQGRRPPLPPADRPTTTSSARSSAAQYIAARSTATQVPDYRHEVTDFFSQAEPADPRPDHDRDVRGDAGLHRQLAMGRRAVLPPDRQAAAQAVERGRHPVQGRAERPLQPAPRRPARADRPLAPDPARGGALAPDLLEAARARRSGSTR